MMWNCMQFDYVIRLIKSCEQQLSPQQLRFFLHFSCRAFQDGPLKDVQLDGTDEAGCLQQVLFRPPVFFCHRGSLGPALCPCFLVQGAGLQDLLNNTTWLAGDTVPLTDNHIQMCRYLEASSGSCTENLKKRVYEYQIRKCF